MSHKLHGGHVIVLWPSYVWAGERVRMKPIGHHSPAPRHILAQSSESEFTYQTNNRIMLTPGRRTLPINPARPDGGLQPDLHARCLVGWKDCEHVPALEHTTQREQVQGTVH